MISHTQRFFNPPGLLPPLPYTTNPLRALSRSVEDIHFDLNRNTLPDTRQLHDNAKMFYDFKNKNIGSLPYMGRNNAMSRPCYSPYPNMSSLYYKTSPERKDMNADRSPGIKSMWPMDHVGEYCAELLNRDKHYWTEEETGLMLELYEENKDYFNDNKTKKTKLWSVIANIINKRFSTNVNSEQCSQKYRNLKAEFLKIADPTSLDGGAKKFGRHFIQMKRLIEAEEKTLKGNSNNWQIKEESVESDKSGISPTSDNISLSPTNPQNIQLNRVQLSHCNSTQQMQSNIQNDMQVSLSLATAMNMESPSSMLAGKLDLRSSEERRLDLDTPNNEDNDYKFDNPDLIDPTASLTQLNQGLREKNQCLIDNTTSLNQTVTNINENLRDISPCIEPASEIVLMESPKREILINMSTHEAELLKLPRPSINLKCEESSAEHNYSTTKQPTTTESIIGNRQSTSTENLGTGRHLTTTTGNRLAGATDSLTSDKQIDFQESPLNISVYSNELNEIFNDYFMSRGKELEVYESKERQNIVCMNKCIDVFRKIMMEKIN